VTFSAASLVGNDSGNAILLSGIDRASTNGGTIAGNGPYVYTPPAGFRGVDTFGYEISDLAGQTTIGIVSVTVTADVVAPTVSIAAPLSGAVVSGTVTVSALAGDNVGVVGVTFFDGGAQIADVVSAPFQARTR
jgi:hypothetical protein